MSMFPPRAPISERVARAAQNPFFAALIGGLIVLIVGATAVAAGWVGGETKTIVQSPIAQPAASRQGDGPTVKEIYKQAGPGVVFISAEVVNRTQSPFGLPQEQRGQATGSGFVIDDQGYILTNEHVVDGASKIEVGFSDKKTVTAHLVGADASNDVALLKVDASAKDLHPLPLGDSDHVSVGDPVVAIGNPFGLDRTVTTGIVSALQRQLESPNGFTIDHVLQTDAAINPGNSGGPLLDSRGRVIGINSQIATAGGGGSVGIGFAVPINTVKKVAEQLKKEGKVEHAFLGITGLTITSKLSSSLNLPTDKGVLVQAVTDQAKKAGIKGGDTQVSIGGNDLVLGGDVITKIDGRAVATMQDVIKAVDAHKPGDQVTVDVLRGSSHKSIVVDLTNRPQDAQSSFQQNQSQVPQNQDLIP
jgi:S1-C subfamily serine protease